MLQQQTDSGAPIPEDAVDLINELRVYQAELEIQNEELKRAQLELSELQREYEKLYEFAPCGYVTLNPNGIVSRTNLTAVKLLGQTKKQIQRNVFSQFIDPGYVDAFIAARQICGQTRQRQFVEVPLISGKGGPIWIRIDISADCAEDGQVLQWSMTLIDITEQKKAQAELNKLHDELRARVAERTESLSQTNDALKALLDLREVEKRSIEQAMLNNLRRYVFHTWMNLIHTI